MGKKDTVLREFFKDNDRTKSFIEFYFNVYSKTNSSEYNKNPLNIDKIYELSEAEASIIKNSVNVVNSIDKSSSKASNWSDVQKNRDVLKDVILKQSDDNIYAIIGIENQSAIDETMIARCMVYDALNYLTQFKNVSSKKDLKPVITIVFYLGEKSWNPELELFKILNIDENHPLHNFASNYRMNFININNTDNEQSQLISNKDVRYILESIRDIYKMDDLSLEDRKTLISKYNNYRNTVNEIAIAVQQIFTGMVSSLDSKEGIAMCESVRKFFEDIEEEKRQFKIKTIEEARVEARREVREEIQQKVEKAQQKVEKAQQEAEKAQQEAEEAQQEMEKAREEAEYYKRLYEEAIGRNNNTGETNEFE